MSSHAARELEVIDRALCGEPTASEHAHLAKLTLEIRALRPMPSEALLARLDASASRAWTASRNQAPQKLARKQRRLRDRVRQPAFALGSAVALTVAVVLGLALTNQRRHSAPAPRPDGASASFSPQRAPYANRATQSSPAAAATAIPAPGATGPSQPAASAGVRQVERTASLDVGVSPASINTAAQKVFELSSGSGGYVEQSTVSSGQGQQGGASFTLRVPSARLSGLIAALTDIGRVRSETDTTNDITGELNSLRRALADAQAERRSLLARLTRAVGDQQVEALRARLRATERRISDSQGALGQLTARVAYTEVALSLTPESEKKPAAALTPSGALGAAGEILTMALAVLLLAASAALPLAALAGIAAFVLTFTRRRARERALDAA